MAHFKLPTANFIGWKSPKSERRKSFVSLNWIQAAIASGFKLDSYSASNIGLPLRI